MSEAPPWESFQAALDSMPTAIAALEGRDSVVTYANRAFRTAFTPGASDILGLRLSDVCTHSSPLTSLQLSVAASGAAASIEEGNCGPTWWRMTATPIVREGVITGAMLSAADIGERDPGGEVQVRFLDQVFDALDGSFSLMTYPDLKVMVVNRKLCDWCSSFSGRPVTKGDILGQALENVVPEGVVHNPYEIAHRAGRTGEIQRVEPACYMRPNGVPAYAKVVYVPIVENGVVTHLVNSSVDVTRVVLAQQRMEDSLVEQYGLLGQVLDAIDIGMSVTSYPKLRYAYTNRYNAEWLSLLTGKVLTEELVVGRLREEVLESDAHGLSAVAVRAGRTGQTQVLETIGVEKSGQPRYYKVVYMPLMDSRGSASHVVGLVVDVSDIVQAQQRSEAMIQARYDSLGRVLDSIDVAMSVYTYPEASIVYLNRQSCLLISNVTGRSISEADAILAHAGTLLANSVVDCSPYLSLGSLAGRTGTTQMTGPRKLRFKDGDVYMETTFSPVIEDGIVTHIVQTSVDVTALIEAQENIEKLSEAKDELLATCSHELRTPLTVMLGNLQLLNFMRGKLGPDRQDQSVDTMIAQCKKMDRLITDLMDYSRLTSGRLDIEMRPIALNELVADLVDSFSRGCATHDIAVEELAPCEVQGDQARLEQVLMNLLSNAVRYSKGGTRVRVSMKVEPDLVSVTVKDEGNGISAAALPHLFEKYYRAPEARQQTDGMGIGLYVCNEIAKLHRGRMRVSSEHGNGSAFTVELPRRSS